MAKLQIKGIEEDIYTRIKKVAAAEKMDGEKKRLLKEAYDRIFSDEEILKEQGETAKWFKDAGSEGGQEW
ncbi:MAG: hypothetical protein HY881_11075 [Deltaproteobacteria bacterium]|nr:hypothetical protein [Deltaproteobacteria bacterium]